MYLMKSMFWTNEKLSLMVAGSSSVSLSCFKVRTSIGNLVCVFFPFQLLEDKYLTSIRARLRVAMLGGE